MDIKILNTDFSLAGYINGFTSLQYTRSLFEVGTFELHVSSLSSGQELKRGRLIYIDAKHCGYIKKVMKAETTNGIEYVAYGSELKSLTGSRIVLPDETADMYFYGYDRYPPPEAEEEPVEDVVKYYAYKHLCGPQPRGFPNLVIAPSKKRGEKIRWSSRFQTLEQLYIDIGSYTGTGYSIETDIENKQFIFDFVPKTDKTVNSTDPVIFSGDFANLYSVKYTEDESALVNCIYAGGAGEDESRMIIEVSDEENAGFERIEGWEDCGSIEYPEDLIYEAKQKSKSKILKTSISGTALESGAYKYLEDWDIGDVVTLRSKSLGVEADRQITEVYEAWEGDAKEMKITFGERNNTILDEIRKREVIY